MALSGRASAASAPQASTATADSSSPQPQAQATTVAQDASLTNVQEAGVDEPDQIKTDGTRFFNIVNGLKVRSVRLARGTASIAGTVDLPAGYYQDLLLAGDRLIVFGTARRDTSTAQYYDNRWAPEASIVTIDISDLAAMRVTSVLSFQGRVVSSRLVGGVARVVVESNSVGPKFVAPADGSPEAQQRATDENKAIVDNSSLDDWVPHYTLNDFSTGEQKQTTGRLCNCDKALHPSVLPGFDTVSVLTIDPNRPTPGNGVTIQGSGGTVYASRDGLYVSSYEFPSFVQIDPQPAPPQPQPAQSDQVQPQSEPAQSPPAIAVRPVGTSIHKFDITGADAARYAGSGLIPGSIKDQFSMSEFEGVLRAVTTTFEDTSVTALTTMAERDGVLVPVGSVGDIGRGESVQAVRMLGRLGYVVTFRRTDPLFVIDLSNPALPRIVGELKVPGFSAYLHPIDDGHLLGVGHTTDENGRTSGVQASVFDVTDPTKPKQTALADLGSGSSPVDNDHHAFFRMASNGLTAFPIYSNDFRGAVVLTTTADVVKELGRLKHTGRQGTERNGQNYTDDSVTRVFVVGDVVYTLSYAGLLASDAGSLADVQWLPLGN
jgi:uncharacterized secreted protein with C-terminal beta-propeller domain